jgi:nucleoside-diphosphate-sugar epimerase
MPHALSHKKILVTGGAGFLGRHLVRELCSLGHSPVAVTRRLDRLDRDLSDLENVRWVEADLSSLEQVTALLRAEQPEVLFHLAGTRVAEKYQRGDSNIVSGTNLFAASRDSSVKRIVILGSASEYGDQPGPLSEDVPVRPSSAYGISKSVVTGTALTMFEEYGFPVVILRPFTVYGPHQPAEMFVAEATHSAVNGLPFKMSAGTQKRDLVFVDDVVAAIVASSSAAGVEGKIINVGSGQARRLRDVAELIWQISDSKAPLLIGERPASESDMHDTWADISRAKELLNWAPQTSLEDGLRRTIEWASANGGDSRLIEKEMTMSDKP